jgi:hypothetical protein
MTRNKEQPNSPTPNQRTLRDRVKLPAATVAGLGAATAAILLAGGLDHKPSISQTLRRHTAQILDQNTGCYDFGKHPVVTSRSEIIDGVKRSIVSIPIRDTSTHKPGQDTWLDRGTNTAVSLLQSQFQANYSVLGGKRLSEPVPGVIQPSSSTTPSSTAYSLDLDVDTARPGARIANVFYAADVAVQDNTSFTTLRGEKLCGAVGFTVEPNGSISHLHTLAPTDQIGTLHITQGVDAWKGPDMTPGASGRPDPGVPPGSGNPF